jgi:DNA-binding NarL/FixJ family response regulator
MKPITVLLAEDHMIVREGLRALLEAEDDIAVVGEAETGRQAVQLAKRLRPAVIVMDIAMPLLNGLEATRQILKAVPAARVLILSAHGDDEYIRQAVMLGAAGYLIKRLS